MQDNYNYYTSTYHSTSLKTFYVALNRLGGPRKTHVPANKPLGKLSTYVRSFTLTVPEAKTEAVIAKLFGANRIKHGMKQLCDAGHTLTALTANKLWRPTGCNAPTIAPKKVAVKNVRRPAALTERVLKRKCGQDNCPKKKKMAAGSLPGGPTVDGVGKPKAKAKKNPVKKSNKNRKMASLSSSLPASTSTTEKPRVTTEEPRATTEDYEADDPTDHDEDDWEYSSIPTISQQVSLVEDDDDASYDN